MINAINIALSGLTASTKKIDTAASNIANVSTSGSLTGGNAPYSALQTNQSSLQNGGVGTSITSKDPGFVPAFDPNSPFANEDGLIGVPNVNLAEEAVNLKLAETTYKANLKVLETVSELSDELLNAIDDTV